MQLPADELMELSLHMEMFKLFTNYLKQLSKNILKQLSKAYLMQLSETYFMPIQMM